MDWQKGFVKLINPAKHFHWKLAGEVIREMKKTRDADGVLLFRKAMMRCAAALNINVLWKLQKLFPHLQEIVRKYPDFNGISVANGLKLDGEPTESNREV